MSNERKWMGMLPKDRFASALKIQPKWTDTKGYVRWVH